MQKENIKQTINIAIASLQKRGEFLGFKLPEIKVETPADKNNGDFSTNFAMVVAGILKKDPLETAQIIAQELKFLDKKKQFLQIEIVKPGFINFFISKDILIKELNNVLKEKKGYGSGKSGKGKTIVIDYSSPNIAKSFGIGHLRSTIIGQAIYNIYKFLGWKCVGDNHLGDWGTQFGKLIVAIKKWSNKDSRLSVAELEKLYVRFHKEVESNPVLIDEARAQFQALEAGDKQILKIWKECVNVSLKEFEKIYNLLNVKIDHAFSESFYEPMLIEIIEEANKKKVASRSQGALIVKFPKDELPPAMLLKSDGATTYLTRDLATIKYRLKKWKPNTIVYEVGIDQSLHFKQLFFTAELLGWAKRNIFVHVAHGLMRTSQGKFSTRKGQTIHLEKVLNEAIEMSKQIIQESSTVKNFKTKEIEKLAKQIGIGAVKYNDLKQHPSSDIIFDWDKVLNLKGNSGPYLQYVFARCQSILQKNKEKISLKDAHMADIGKYEENILRTILCFKDVIREAAEKFSPNLICNFAFELAKTYNAFYNNIAILKTENKESRQLRLAITTGTAQVLENALYLLGIETPEKM